MPYRRTGEAREVRTAAGPHEITTSVDGLTVRGPDDAFLRITHDAAFIETRRRREVCALRGRVLAARNVPREDVAIWIESPRSGADAPSMRRIFGLAPTSIFEGDHLACVRQLSAAFSQISTALRPHAGDVIRATELGTGRHRMLLVERPDRHLVYTSRLFREAAPLVMTIFRDGRVVFHHEPDAIRVVSDVAIKVHGHDVRFTDANDADLARFAFPWLAPDDRAELARRLSLALRR